MRRALTRLLERMACLGLVTLAASDAVAEHKKPAVEFTVTIKAQDRCTWDQRHASCVRLGGKINLSVRLSGSQWASSPNTIITESCSGSTGRLRSRRHEVVNFRSEGETTWVGEVETTSAHEGMCEYRFELLGTESPGTSQQRTASILVRPSSIIVDSTSFVGPKLARPPQQVDWTLYEPNYVPFLREGTNARTLERNVQDWRVVGGQDVIHAGAVARKKLEDIRLPDVNDEVNRQLIGVLKKWLNEQGDLLGYRLFDSLKSWWNEKRNMDDGRRVCLPLAEQLMSVLRAHQVVDVSIGGWTNECLRTANEFSRQLSQSSTLPRYWVLRRVFDGRSRVFQAVSALRNADSALVAAGDSIFAKRLGEALRRTESYTIQPVDEAGEQGVPVEMKVATFRRLPDFGISIDVALPYRSYDKGVVANVLASSWINFLEGSFFLEMRAGASASLRTRRGGGSFQITGNADAFCGIAVVVAVAKSSALKKTDRPSQCASPRFRLYVGAGYDAYSNLPIARTGIGWKFQIKREFFLNPTLYFQTPFLLRYLGQEDRGAGEGGLGFRLGGEW